MVVVGMIIGLRVMEDAGARATADALDAAFAAELAMIHLAVAVGVKRTTCQYIIRNVYKWIHQ